MIKIGGQRIADIRIGGSKIKEARIGGGLVWNRGRFLAIGRLNNSSGIPTGILYETHDFTTWTELFRLENGELKYIAFGNGRWVIVGDGGMVRHSSDGVSWTRIQLGAEDFTGVYFAKDRFFAQTETSMHISSDGASWQKVYDGYPYGIAYGNGKFVSSEGSGGGLIYSNDGLNWSSKQQTGRTSYEVAFGNGVFVAGAKTGYVLRSEDGIKWDEVKVWSKSIGAVADFTHIAFGNGRFVATSIDSIAYSVDGINWIRGGIESGIPVGIIFANGNFIRFTSRASNQTIYTSKLGDSWKSYGASGVLALYGMAFG